MHDTKTRIKHKPAGKLAAKKDTHNWARSCSENMQAPKENKKIKRNKKTQWRWQKIPTCSTPSMQSEHKEIENREYVSEKKTICLETQKKQSHFSFLPTGTPVS